MIKNIAVIQGDGIGVEITNSAILVLKKIADLFGHTFNFNYVLMGGCAIDKTGVPLPNETIEICKKSDSVLLGAVGGKKWESLPGHLRPEKGLLQIRKELNLFANIRPAYLFKQLINACPLREDIANKGIDLVVVRELTGGIYFGKRGRFTDENGVNAFDTEAYNENEIERIVRIAFNLALKRNKHLTSIDKANVLESSRLWREVVHKIHEEFPEVVLDDMLVDNASMQLVKNPAFFDVIVTSNMFGDILSDEAGMITGSIGMLASSSLGNGNLGLYEPIHGSAPDIAGQNIANPIATILSAALMLKNSFDMPLEAEKIEKAISNVLDKGFRTFDIISDRKTVLSCSEMTDKILSEISHCPH